MVWGHLGVKPVFKEHSKLHGGNSFLIADSVQGPKASHLPVLLLANYHETWHQMYCMLTNNEAQCLFLSKDFLGISRY